VNNPGAAVGQVDLVVIEASNSIVPSNRAARRVQPAQAPAHPAATINTRLFEEPHCWPAISILGGNKYLPLVAQQLLVIHAIALSLTVLATQILLRTA